MLVFPLKWETNSVFQLKAFVQSASYLYLCTKIIIMLHYFEILKYISITQICQLQVGTTWKYVKMTYIWMATNEHLGQCDKNKLKRLQVHSFDRNIWIPSKLNIWYEKDDINLQTLLGSKPIQAPGPPVRHDGVTATRLGPSSFTTILWITTIFKITKIPHILSFLK